MNVMYRFISASKNNRDDVEARLKLNGAETALMTVKVSSDIAHDSSPTNKTELPTELELYVVESDKLP